MKRSSLAFQVFLSIMVVAVGAVAAVGLIARDALSKAFDSYLASLPTPMGGAARPRMGRMMLGAAEQTFVASVDRSVYLGAALAVVAAGVVAFLVARYLTHPILRLEAAAKDLAAGELSHRVDANGPAEVAALGDAFNHMADSLEEAEMLRRRLVADVAHELRNPIAVLRIQAEGMAEGVIAAEPPVLDSLVEELQHLSSLVDDLQELSSAEAGRLHYEMEPIDLAELAQREAERAAKIAPDGVHVTSEGMVGERYIVGDQRRLSEVLRNLLGNALKYTPQGDVSVVIQAIDDQRVEVAVRDTGAGISPEDLPHVFERFYRADKARSAHTGGAGLGLAISRRIVEDHGGTVFADSVAGEGAVVGFRLPLA